MMLLGVVLFARTAHADQITVVLDQPVQSTHNNATTVNFFATITADPGNAGDVYLNSDSFSVDTPFSVDDLGLFINFPWTVSPGQSFHDVLFTVDMPGTQADGVYLGSFSILGGSDSAALDTLGSVNFEIDQTMLTGVPEPSAFWLLGSGLLTLPAMRGRRGGTAA